MANILDPVPISALNSYATTGRRHAIDHFALGQNNISTEHYHIHMGVHFFHSATAEVDSGDFFYHSIKTPSQATHVVECHILNEFTFTGAVLAELIEGPTGITPATAPFNSRRASLNTAEALVDSSTAASGSGLLTGGTVIESWLVGITTGGGNASEGNVRREAEWALKPDTLYVMRYTSAFNGNRITSRMRWYETSPNEFGA